MKQSWGRAARDAEAVGVGVVSLQVFADFWNHALAYLIHCDCGLAPLTLSSAVLPAFAPAVVACGVHASASCGRAAAPSTDASQYGARVAFHHAWAAELLLVAALLLRASLAFAVDDAAQRVRLGAACLACLLGAVSASGSGPVAPSLSKESPVGGPFARPRGLAGVLPWSCLLLLLLRVSGRSMDVSLAEEYWPAPPIVALVLLLPLGLAGPLWRMRVLLQGKSTTTDAVDDAVEDREDDGRGSGTAAAAAGGADRGPAPVHCAALMVALASQATALLLLYHMVLVSPIMRFSAVGAHEPQAGTFHASALVLSLGTALVVVAPRLLPAVVPLRACLLAAATVQCVYSGALVALAAMQRRQSLQPSVQDDTAARFAALYWVYTVFAPWALFSRFGLTAESGPFARPWPVWRELRARRPAAAAALLVGVSSVVVATMLVHFNVYVYQFVPAGAVWRDRSYVVFLALALAAFVPSVDWAVAAQRAPAKSVVSVGDGSGDGGGDGDAVGNETEMALRGPEPAFSPAPAPAPAHTPVFATTRSTHGVLWMEVGAAALIFAVTFAVAVGLSPGGGDDVPVSALANATTSAATAPPLPTDTVRLVSFNVHLGLDRRGRRRLRAMADDIAGFSADVVSLQEAETTSFLFQGTDAAYWLGGRLNRLYYYGARYSPGRWSPKLLFRRTPLEMVTTRVDYANTTGDDRPNVQNSFVRATLLLPPPALPSSAPGRHLLHFYTIHCSTRDAWALSEVRHMLRDAAQFERSDDPNTTHHVVFGGDFNFDESAPELYGRLAARYQEAWPVIHGASSSPPDNASAALPTDTYEGWTNQESLGRIDQFWVSSGLEVIGIAVPGGTACARACRGDGGAARFSASCLDCSTSDHLPVVLDIRVRS